jgi:hypothetical protein
MGVWSPGAGVNWTAIGALAESLMTVATFITILLLLRSRGDTDREQKAKMFGAAFVEQVGNLVQFRKWNPLVHNAEDQPGPQWLATLCKFDKLEELLSNTVLPAELFTRFLSLKSEIQRLEQQLRREIEQRERPQFSRTHRVIEPFLVQVVCYISTEASRQKILNTPSAKGYPALYQLTNRLPATEEMCWPLNQSLSTEPKDPVYSNCTLAAILTEAAKENNWPQGVPIPGYSTRTLSGDHSS